MHEQNISTAAGRGTEMDVMWYKVTARLLIVDYVLICCLLRET